MIMNYITKIKANISIYASKKTSNILDGTYKSIYKGKSMNFEDLRTYVIGDNVKDIDESLDYKMYELICHELRKNNYKHYEISNFSKQGYESKHNLCYWNNSKYYGFGLGASSYLNNERITNTKSINKYLAGKFRYQKEILTTKDIIEYELILSLRKKTGINLKLFQEKYRIKLDKVYNYHDLVKKSLLCECDNYLFIPEDKWYISNEIIVKILGCEVNE